MKKYTFNELEEMEKRVDIIIAIIALVMFGVALITGFYNYKIEETELLRYVSTFAMGASIVTFIFGFISASVAFIFIETIQDKFYKKHGSN